MLALAPPSGASGISSAIRSQVQRCLANKGEGGRPPRTARTAASLLVAAFECKSNCMITELLATAKALPLPQRIELAEALWGSITQDSYEPPLTPAQEAEIDRRLQEHRRHPQSAIRWEEVKAELEQKHGGPG